MEGVQLYMLIKSIKFMNNLILTQINIKHKGKKNKNKKNQHISEETTAN